MAKQHPFSIQEMFEAWRNLYRLAERMEDPPNATLAALTALETKIVESEPVTLEDYKVQALILLSWINDGAPLSRRFDARIAAVYNKRFIPAVRLDQETEGAA